MNIDLLIQANELFKAIGSANPNVGGADIGRFMGENYNPQINPEAGFQNPNLSLASQDGGAGDIAGLMASYVASTKNNPSKGLLDMFLGGKSYGGMSSGLGY